MNFVRGIATTTTTETIYVLLYIYMARTYYDPSDVDLFFFFIIINISVIYLDIFFLLFIYTFCVHMYARCCNAYSNGNVADANHAIVVFLYSRCFFSSAVAFQFYSFYAVMTYECEANERKTTGKKMKKISIFSRIRFVLLLIFHFATNNAILEWRTSVVCYCYCSLLFQLCRIRTNIEISSGIVWQPTKMH